MGNVNAIFPFFCVKCAYPCKRTPFFFNSFPEIYISDADSRPAAAQKEKTGVPFSGRRFSLSKNLVEFAPAGAKKVQSFSSATCAAKKILLGLQTCEPAASADSACAAVRQPPLCQKRNTFLTVSTGVPFSGRRFGLGSVYARLAQKPSNIVAIWSRVALPCGARKT